MFLLSLFIVPFVFLALMISLKIVFTVFGIVFPIISLSFGLIFKLFGGILMLMGMIFLFCLVF